MGKQALEGARMNAFAMDPEDLTVIGWDEGTEDKVDHPLFDERAKLPLDEKMIASIMLLGVLETVLVRKNGDDVEVAAGRQRVKNAREANNRLLKQGKEPIRVPCMVKRASDADLFGVSIAENEIRSDDLPSVKARKLQRLLAMGKTEKEAAITFGVSLQSIKNWLKLGDLDPKLLKAADSGQVPASAVWNLADLSREDQRQKLEELLKSGKTTVREVKQQAKKARKGEQTDYEPPGKRLINKVLRANEKAGKVLNGDFVKGISWVLGDIGPTSVAGLTDLIREAQGEKKE